MNYINFDGPFNSLETFPVALQNKNKFRNTFGSDVSDCLSVLMSPTTSSQTVFSHRQLTDLSHMTSDGIMMALVPLTENVDVLEIQH